MCHIKVTCAELDERDARVVLMKEATKSGIVEAASTRVATPAIPCRSRHDQADRSAASEEANQVRSAIATSTFVSERRWRDEVPIPPSRLTPLLTVSWRSCRRTSNRLRVPPRMHHEPVHTPGGARCYGLTTLKVPPKAWIPLPLPTDPVRIGLPIPSTAGCSWL